MKYGRREIIQRVLCIPVRGGVKETEVQLQGRVNKSKKSWNIISMWRKQLEELNLVTIIFGGEKEIQ